ncbi:Threonine--tRNA ligase, cytoplasmic [Gossypium arboreum]|uniref:Threonine--tRNA ligase, cytoplasmic n=1 Tax=Gossypium arboreum TaxID=29729 RepID=A0A0B0NTP7_GOSAR|nr:Threonine--tRNA ligase, cytoplasmic [Gossypium arboreum]
MSGTWHRPRHVSHCKTMFGTWHRQFTLLCKACQISFSIPNGFTGYFKAYDNDMEWYNHVVSGTGSYSKLIRYEFSYDVLMVRITLVSSIYENDFEILGLYL